jgi:hypothetical protein
MTTVSAAPSTSGSRIWPVPAALITLAAIPVLAGSARLVQLAGGPELLPARSDPSPIPLATHIISAIGYAGLGAFQFSPALWRRRPRWHRAAGRLLILLGLVVALSALWLTLFHPRTERGDLLYLFRLLAGSGMAASLVLGYTTIRRRDLVRHKAWMIRAHALALGAGTQVFTTGIGEGIFEVSDLSVALLQGAGWGINLAVAEWIIRRPQQTRPTSRTVTSS